MKIKKIFSYTFGTIFLLIALVAFSLNDIFSCLMGVMFCFLAVLVFPIFNIICILANKKFSTKRKLALGIITFFIPPFLFAGEDLTMEYISTEIIAIIFFWAIMFLTNKKTYFQDTETPKIESKSKKENLFQKIYNKKLEKRNLKLLAILEEEQKIRNNFNSLNIMTINMIAQMISETEEKHNSALNIDMPKINIGNLVISFCKDSQNIQDETLLNDLYTTQYYINKINNHCSELSNYIKQKIKKRLPNQNKNQYLNIYNKYLNIISKAMPSYAELKFYQVQLSNDDLINKCKDYGINLIDYTYRDCFIYLIDLLATCTCISKMIFIENKIKKLNKEHEFYKIISNMNYEFKDISIIIEKSRPIYDEFYKSDLGFIDSQLYYAIAITILSNKINNKPLSSEDETILELSNKKINNFSNLDTFIKEWISSVSINYRNLDFKKYIIFKILNTIDISNFDLYFKALAKTKEYIRLYYSKVEHNNKVTDKERYLNGDFEKEKIELSGKYTLNNITTGTQFELYLVNLFNDLGYKTKHNGKAGDQGCDLIVKKDDYVYAIQAKYYTGKLSNTPVQEIIGSLKYYNANQGVVITNSSFTPGAEELAKANNVILIDGVGLKKLADYIFEDNLNKDILKDFEF